MDRLAIRRRRRLLLGVATGILAAGLVSALLFGRRWQQAMVLQAFGSPDDAKVAWAKGRLGRLSDKGAGLLLGQLGRQGELFDLRVADYLEDLGQADRLPVELRVRAALTHLTDPVLAPVGFARLLELPPEACEGLLDQSVGLEASALHGAARAAAKLNAQRSSERARELLSASAPAQRRLGLALLGALGEEANSTLVLAGLRDGDASVRAEGIYDLVLIQGRRAPPAVAPLLGDPEERVRAAALIAVINTGQAEDANLLLPALRDETEGLRARAVLGLALLGPEAHADAILALSLDRSPQVRAAVATASGALPGDGGLEALLQLKGDSSAEVRKAATESLARKSTVDRAFAALREQAEDASLEVVRAAYGGLVDCRRREAVAFFIAALTDERPSWALDPLPPEIAGAPAKALPRAALANCALRWLTGQDFGWHWRAPQAERDEARRRWQDWYEREGSGLDLARVARPQGLTSYEQLLRRAPVSPTRAP